MKSGGVDGGVQMPNEKGAGRWWISAGAGWITAHITVER